MTNVHHRLRSALAVAALATAAVACGGDEVADPPAAETTTTVPDETVPEETVPDDTVPDDTLPEETVPDDTVPDETVPDDTVVPSGPNTDGWPIDSALIDAAVDDLVATVGVAPGAVEVVLAEPVTWRNGALGCPVPGRDYTQALVDGYRIELTADGDTYWYHGGGDNDPFRCDDPQDPAPEGSGDR